MKIEKIDKKSPLRLLAIILVFVLPVALVIVSIFIFRTTKQEKEKVFEEKIETEERLIPSQILNNKSKYNQQRIIVRGRVSTESAVCEKKECPMDDPCCGCPLEIDLIIADAGTILSPKTGGRLRLSNIEGNPFCQRSQLSCEYHCGDWIEGVIYDVGGKFFAEAPPPGWKLSLNYYFQVEDKDLIRERGFGEFIGDVLREIKELVQKFKTSGYYVLP